MLPPNASIDSNSNATEIKVKVAYNGEIMITYIQEAVTYDQLCREIRGICRFSPEQFFTMKWIDEENDPCTISSQIELKEAIRLYEVNRDSELVMHVSLEQMKTNRIIVSVAIICLLNSEGKTAISPQADTSQKLATEEVAMHNQEESEMPKDKS